VAHAVEWQRQLQWHWHGLNRTELRAWLINHFTDNIGKHPQLVAKETIEAVVKKFPRKKWSRCFAGTLRDEVGRKPWAHTTHIKDFEEMVEGNELMELYE